MIPVGDWPESQPGAQKVYGICSFHLPAWRGENSKMVPEKSGPPPALAPNRLPVASIRRPPVGCEPSVRSQFSVSVQKSWILRCIHCPLPISGVSEKTVPCCADPPPEVSP